MRTRTLLGPLLGVTLVGSSVALAGGLTLEPHFDSEKVGPSQRAKVVTKCPRGTEVVSGGFAAPERVYAGGGPYTDATAAERVGDRAFAVKAEDDGPFRHGKIYAYAYCGDLGRITVAEAASKPIGSFKTGSAVARCPRGDIAISGGFAGSGERGQPAMLPYVSQRLGKRRWKVAALNEVLKGSHRLIAYAYCLEGRHSVVTVATASRLERFNQSSAGSACPPGAEALSGGFDATRKGWRGGDATVYSSRRKNDGRRWKISLINGNDSIKKVIVYAYCTAPQ